MLFKANWLLLLINLLPVHPLDGGRMLSLALHSKLDGFVARTVYLRIGAIVGVGFVIAGVLYDSTLVMLVGAIVLPLNILESQQQPSESEGDESFLGYDFSQGYTSLERSTPESEGEDNAGWLARRKAQREEEAAHIGDGRENRTGGDGRIDTKMFEQKRHASPNGYRDQGVERQGAGHHEAQIYVFLPEPRRDAEKTTEREPVDHPDGDFLEPHAKHLVRLDEPQR